MKFNLDLNNVNYVKFNYTDRFGTMHYVKASIKDINERNVLACAHFEDRIFVVLPQEVDISFISESGIYKTKTTLKAVEQDIPYIFFSFVIPYDINFEQNREFFRIKHIDGAFLSFNDGDSEKRITCKTADVSANGVCLELTQKINIPKEVKIGILFDRREVITDAEFIRISTDDSAPKASFKFVNMSEKDKDFISKFCIQKQIEEKRGKLDD